MPADRHVPYYREVAILDRGRWYVGRCAGCDYQSGKVANPGHVEQRAREHAAAMNGDPRAR